MSVCREPSPSAPRAPNPFRKIVGALGVTAAIGLAGYGLSYLVVMPKVSPDGFVPSMSTTRAGTSFGFGAILAMFVLIYAFAFLPVNIAFTVRQYRTNPLALVLACCLCTTSSLIELINNLPVVAAGIYPGRLENIPPEVRLYLRQVETIRYLSFDAAGFVLIYLAFFIYAMVYVRSRRRMSFMIFGSIATFFANVPCLWFAPSMAVALLAVSVLALAPVPISLARMAIENRD